MATVTRNTIPQEVTTFYNMNLLKRLVPKLVWAKFGDSKPIPKGSGDKISFRGFDPLPVSTEPLTEGVKPSGKTNTVTEITATLDEYGDYVMYSDMVSMTAIDPYITETTDVLGEQAAETIDTVIRDKVVLGTNVQYCGGKLSTATVTASDKLTSEEIRKAVRTLKNNNVKPAQGSSYIGVIDPDVEFDLMNDPLWQDVSKYNGGEKIMSGEIGKLCGVRFITTTQVATKKGADDTNVHCCMILGKGAYGVVDLKNSARKPRVLIKPLGSAGTEDPLNQKGSIGWKGEFTAVVLNQLAMIRLECAASE